ncbi:MAG: hypothetical protein ACQEP8_06745 [Chlamydiota bacterium]
MLKKVLFILITIALLLTIASSIYLWNIRIEMTNRYLSKATGTEVTISDLKITPASLKIKNFMMENPADSELKTAFSAKEINITFNPFKLITSPHLINNIEIDNVEIGIEKYHFFRSGNNWIEIFDNLHNNNQKINENSDPTLIIRTLILRNVTVNVDRPLIGTTQLHLDKIHLSNVGKKTILSPYQAMEIVFALTLKYIIENPEIGHIVREVLFLPKHILNTLISQQPQHLNPNFHHLFLLPNKFFNTKEALIISDDYRKDSDAIALEN